jgi:hypothetical protein
MAGKTFWDLSRTKPAAIPNAIAAKMILSQLSSARHLAGYLEATPDRQQKLHIKLPKQLLDRKKTIDCGNFESWRLMVKSGRTENLLGVVTQYEILGFCRLALNQRKFYPPKT